MQENDSLWELYGLRTNPFSTSPLLVKGGLLPIESFYGRENELKRLTKIFSAGGGSRILVCGDVGVGKTSFVNYARYLALRKGHFTPFKEIGVQNDWNATSFIMNTLYSFYSTLVLENKDLVSKKTLEKLRNLVELPTTQVQSTGINIGGLGLTFGKSPVGTQSVSTIALIDFFQQLVVEIKDKTGKDVIIHYNNLERLNEKVLRELFEDLRDFFQTGGVHFVFVGNLTVQSLFQSMPRVSSIMSDTPILLNEFLFEDIEEVIRIRIEMVKIDKLNYIVPYRAEVLKMLYDLYGGNIRNILNSLSTALIELTNEKAVVLDHNLLATTLRGVIEKRYLAGIVPRAKSVLLEAVKHAEITNRHLSAATKIARSNISTYVQELEKHGCLYLRRKDGKDKYWSVEPKVKWLLLKTADASQTELQDFVGHNRNS